jgi:integrase
MFYDWCYRDRGLLSEPTRNLYAKSLRFVVPKRLRNDEDIKVLPNEAIHALLDASTTYNTLYPAPLIISLALNTGMNLADIAELRIHNVKYNEKTGGIHINKRRSKTGVKGRWRLWDDTAEMLLTYIIGVQHHLGVDDDLNLDDYIFPPATDIEDKLGAHRPTVQSRKSKNGRLYSYCQLSDPISNVFKHGNVALSPMFLRKTSATALKEMSQGHTVLYQHFLCHSPKSMADKKYAGDLPDEFRDPYVLKLVDHYDIKEKIVEVREKFTATIEERYQCPKIKKKRIRTSFLTQSTERPS